jgi:hypothetical protein
MVLFDITLPFLWYEVCQPQNGYFVVWRDFRSVEGRGFASEDFKQGHYYSI